MIPHKLLIGWMKISLNSDSILRAARKSIFNNLRFKSSGGSFAPSFSKRLECTPLLSRPQSFNLIQKRLVYQDAAPQTLPRLIYMPNVFRWMKHKFEFWILAHWDPDFNEGAFRYGTRQAVSTITNVLQTRKYEQLSDLMTRNARTMLIYEFETRWPSTYKDIVALKPEEIQLIIPRKLAFNRSLGRRICEVDLVFIGLKWSEYRSRRAMVFMETFARFKRDFDNRLVPEWTISLFKIHRFQIIHRRTISVC
ncbi:uncharacterized protein LOC123305825 isoform X2 [Chrysoperla carnea]|uniref:uncharacterized protein LOC123305825 isoform X2 n=1 Tax=Chrysoperla carnea TaxID=189513 RepID=UPI001D071B48|nr:uncharacterized protein LOC123305825 isoform X2 [Chrysoperla carnea]